MEVGKIPIGLKKYDGELRHKLQCRILFNLALDQTFEIFWLSFVCEHRQERRVSSDHAGKLDISEKVSIFCQ